MEKLSNELKAELKSALAKFESMASDKDKDEALKEFARVGAKLDIDRLRKVMACSCGPSGERGVEDGLCPT